MSNPVFVVGDVHGHREALVRLLRDAGLIDRAERWRGADARLWLVGDLVDRGPDGLPTIELVMRLEREGAVGCLLGNHELLLLGVHRFGGLPVWDRGPTFADLWLSNGGRLSDLDGLRSEHVAWLTARPALAIEGNWLVLHADTDRYLELGSSAEDVNLSVGRLLQGDDVREYGALLERIGDRLVLADPVRRSRLLETFGVTRAVHGHTPIAVVRHCDPSLVVEALVYADGQVLNVDHCLFDGGPGFVTRLDG